jgi:hypothetical protein
MLIYINPLAIQNFLRFKKKKVIAIYDDLELNARRHNKRRFTGLIVKDKAVKTGRKLMECSHFEGTMQRFDQNLEWHNTNYKKLHKTWYQKINGRKHDGKSFDEFYEHRLKKWDYIFNEIKTKGYKKSAKDTDNIEVAIKNDGQILLIDGRHRVAFSQIAGIKQIPVVVNVISESLAQSLTDKHFAESFSNKNLAKAFSENQSYFLQQLNNTDIKERLAIASRRG